MTLIEVGELAESPRKANVNAETVARDGRQEGTNTMSEKMKYSACEEPYAWDPSRVADERIAVPIDTVREVLTLIWKRRRFLAVAWMVALVLSIAFALIVPKNYEATMVLAPPDYNSPSLAIMGALAGGAGSGAGSALGAVSDLLGVKNPGDMYVRTLRTAKVENRIIERFDLRAAFHQKLMVKARAKLEAHSDIDTDKKSGVITVAVRDHDAFRSAAIANSFAEELDRSLMDMNVSSAQRERAFYQQRVTIAERDLNDASKALAQFSSLNATLQPDDQGKAMVDAAAALQGQLIAAQADLRGLQQIYTDQHQQIATAKARVASLNREFQKLVSEGTSASPAKVENPYPSIRRLPILGSRYAELYRNVKVKEAVYQVVVQQYEINILQEVHDLPSVQVLDPATVPERASWLKPILLSIVLFTFITGFSTAWVYAQGRWLALDVHNPYRQILTPFVSGVSALIYRSRIPGNQPAAEPAARPSTSS